jgi:uncharacterized membrane protein
MIISTVFYVSVVLAAVIGVAYIIVRLCGTQIRADDLQIHSLGQSVDLFSLFGVIKPPMSAPKQRIDTITTSIEPTEYTHNSIDCLRHLEGRDLYRHFDSRD